MVSSERVATKSSYHPRFIYYTYIEMYQVGPQGEVNQVGPLNNRAGRIYLVPAHFKSSDEDDKWSPVLNLCLGYNSQNLWRIPNYVPELSQLCSASQYKDLCEDLANTMMIQEQSIFWEYFGFWCCLCTLGLSTLPGKLNKEATASALQRVCDEHSQKWGVPPGTLEIINVNSNSPIHVKEAGLDAIPIDETGQPLLDNIGGNNLISPDLLRIGIVLNHVRLYGTYASVNGIPVYVNPVLGIAPGEHLQMERELQIIDQLDQDFVSWPPLGFSVRVRLRDPLLFQMWPMRNSIQGERDQH